MNLGAVILAAGYSSRMDGFKPLLRLGQKSLLEWCAHLFRQAGIRKIIVVGGHRGEEIRTCAAALGLGYVHNPDYAAGMFSSLQAGVRRLAEIDGFFLLPVDIPLVRPATVQALQSAFDGTIPAIPLFNDRRGHPPLLPGRLIPAILAFDKEGGLESLLQGETMMRDVPVWDAGILMDADTPADFAALVHREARLAIGDRAEALALATLQMPPRGLAHGAAVAKIAETLGTELNRHGLHLNLDILHNAALLHDVAKGRPRHEAQGAELLLSLGLTRLAGIVGAHRDVPPPPSGQLTEQEVVCLADKFVHGSRIVPIRKRFQQKLATYANDPDACRAIRNRLANALILQQQVETLTGKGIAALLGPESAP